MANHETFIENFSHARTRLQKFLGGKAAQILAAHNNRRRRQPNYSCHTGSDRSTVCRGEVQGMFFIIPIT